MPGLVSQLCQMESALRFKSGKNIGTRKHGPFINKTDLTSIFIRYIFQLLQLRSTFLHGPYSGKDTFVLGGTVLKGESYSEFVDMLKH